MIADEAARRGGEGDAGLAHAAGPHFGEVGFAALHLFDDGAGMFVIHVDHDLFVRLHALAVFFLEQHLGAADAQFEAFAAHGFDEDAQLQFTAAGDFETVLVGSFR